MVHITLVYNGYTAPRDCHPNAVIKVLLTVLMALGTSLHVGTTGVTTAAWGGSVSLG